MKNLEFHLESGDYFGTLATVLSLLKDKLERHGYEEEDGEILDRKIEELIYLQRNHGIN